MSVIFRPLLAFILLALSACGGTSGGATAVAVAAQSEEVSAFSAKAELAPSTLLDHHG